MSIIIRDEQKVALNKMHDGCVLVGGVGSGKTITSLLYYKKYHSNKKLLVITTAKKRDSLDWIEEAKIIGITSNLEVNSWNNIIKYKEHSDCFFIFDEQRVVGYGGWVKSFLKITKNNKWVLLSATPGDNWKDYIPLFIANGFYKNKTEFVKKHIEYDPYVSFPKIKRYHNQVLLSKNRNAILVEMKSKKKTYRNEKLVFCSYDESLYKKVQKERWDPFLNCPIENASRNAQILRTITGSSKDRELKATEIILSCPKIIVFYNYIFELEILRNICVKNKLHYSEWNGQKHQPIEKENQWVYLVQYTSGCEGWNCIETNNMLMYSLNYSYKVDEQARGRIDRLNTQFVELNYWSLTSKASIDESLRVAILKKEKFNLSMFFIR